MIAAEQLDSKAAYVACSRGRHQARIFTPEKGHLLERLERTSDRPAASDVIGTSRTAFWRHTDHVAWQRAADHATVFHAAFSRPSPAPEREMSR